MVLVVEPLRPLNALANSRKPLLFISALLLVLFIVASAVLVQIARQQNSRAAERTLFYAEKATQVRQKSILATISDYAFWGEAYHNLHAQIDHEWAYTRQNLGPSLFPDFGYEGVFVVDPAGRTTYAVVEGELLTI